MSPYFPSSRNLFNSNTDKPFRLSRSKIDLFLSCPRCFYMDRRLGLKRPSTFPFNLNNAVDTLLKNEFDQYREKQKPHPLLEENGLSLVPFKHEKMDEWRDALKRGIQFHHEESNFLVTGGIDDLWISAEGSLHIVDYKATSKQGEVGIDSPWQITYKRQIEIYQWLFAQNGFDVSPTGYFVYCNGDSSRNEFNKTLHFDIKLISYEGKFDWVAKSLMRARQCLERETLPSASPRCDYCQYRKTVHNALVNFQPSQQKKPNEQPALPH